MASLQNPEEIYFQKIPRSRVGILPFREKAQGGHFPKFIGKLSFGRWSIFYSRGKLDALANTMHKYLK